MTGFIANGRERAYTGNTMHRSTSRYGRRRFLQGSLGLGGLALLTGCGIALPWAQSSTRVARIGYLAQDRPDGPTFVRNFGAFRQGLGELGWVEGRNMILEVRWAEGRPERLPALAAELAGLPVDVMLATGGTNGALVARRATSTIPIIMVTVSDPVGNGLISSFNRPGGNVTGLTNTTSPTGGKRLDLLREAVPGLARVDFLWNPAVSAQDDWPQLQIAAQALGVEVRSREPRGPDDLDGVFSAIAAARPDGLIVHAPAALVPHAPRVVDHVARLRLPAIYQLRDFVEVGGLMAYGVSLPDQWRRAAGYVDKILKGANPAELPVQQPTTFELVVNLTSAQALRLTIPPSTLQQATDIIE